MSAEFITCPECQGTGIYMQTEQDYTLYCSRCRRTGTVPRTMLGWIEQGAAIRKARIERRESMHDVAIRLGIPKVSWVSDAERGRIDPAKILPKEMLP